MVISYKCFKNMPWSNVIVYICTYMFSFPVLHKQARDVEITSHRRGVIAHFKTDMNIFNMSTICLQSLKNPLKTVEGVDYTNSIPQNAKNGLK